MKRRILYMGFVLITMNACHHEDNSEHNHTKEICDGIFVENYTTFGMGAGGGSMVGDCLTDSITFRAFVGIFDEGYEGINYSCQGDSLRIKFYSHNEQGKFQKDSASYYSIEGLKLLKNYSNDSFFKFKDLKKLSQTTSTKH